MKALAAIGICLLAALSAAAQTPGQWPVGGAPPGAAPPARIHPAVVRIMAPGNGSISYGSGTLVHVGETSGLVVTNWHVINEATQPISVHFPDGFYSLAKVQKVDRDWDLALLEIKKPNVQPVNVAAAAPRPGELLTIAGYGPGTYRTASGPCTQYVAPGTTFPFEMVEVAVSARQGDSGGPIFNARGELAGVLFGEGHGRTSGSYCGRVRWFLSSVVPDGAPNTQMIASAPLKPLAPRPTTGQPRQDKFAGWVAPVVQTSTQPTSATPSQRAPNGVVASTRAAGPQVQSIGWEDVAGATLGEQIKTILALVGVLAILLHALRWMSREPAPA